MYGLVDCNTFYASCEKIFRPDLANKPVVVLSNNDGCIVALSKEAKALGIQRGAPLFKVRDEIELHNVQVFSSNYELYGDISNRVMSVLSRFSPNVEVYSIDEMFLDLHGIDNLEEYCRTIKDAVYRSVGVPVSVGIGETKTLAKLANQIGKKYPCYNGIFNIANHPKIDKIFNSFRVDDVWGVGFQSTKKLIARGICTIADLVKADDTTIKKLLSIKGLYTVRELRGEPYIDLETAQPKQNILSSRSFANKVTDKQTLMESISYHLDLASTEMRSQGSQCSYLTVFIMENRFQDNPYSAARSCGFNTPLDYTNDLLQAAENLLGQIYLEGKQYIKAGVILSGLSKKSDRQLGLFDDNVMDEKKEKLQTAIDRVNGRHGRATIRTGTMNLTGGWQMKREHKSPNYTTAWDELPVAKC